MKRRTFLKQAAAIGALSIASQSPGRTPSAGLISRRPGTRLKLCLNAFSFNKELLSGRMTMNDVVDFCADHTIDGVDMTGYYFPGYPKKPSDEVVYDLKRYAFLNGVTISGTGVRNDLAVADRNLRRNDIRLIKNWIDVAAQLGADVVRVFSGKQIAEGSTFDRTLEWMIPAFQDCAAYGAERGIIVGLQHHHDFLRTADETIRVVEAVNSPWFSVILDVGSLRDRNVFTEVERLIPYTATWQVKQHVWVDGEKVLLDLGRLKRIIEKTEYRGFLPIEVLSGPEETVSERVRNVSAFVADVKNVFFS